MIYWVLIILLFIAALSVAAIFSKRYSRKTKLKGIKELWGKPKNIRRNFGLIGTYLNTCGIRNDASGEDLDLDDVFSFIDRTNSKPGQQYLYKQLYSTKISKDHFNLLEQKIERFDKDHSLRELAELKLTDLNNDDAYSLPELFSQTHLPIFGPIISFYIKIGMPVLAMLTVAFIFVPDQLFFILILLLLITNVIIHISNKSKMLIYTHSLPQVLTLYNVGLWLFDQDLIAKSDAVTKGLASLAKLKKALGFINLQNKVIADPTEISYLLSEWLKMFLLVEPLNFITSIKRVNKYKDDIRLIFECVAEADVAIAIQSVRAGLPYYCIPEFSPDTEPINITDLYHPLIENCVANSITIDNRHGVLITGSNMSGKTTFIRALAINILLSQTINTSLSSKYSAPVLKIFTSINMSDNLGEQTSYFQAEAISIRDIINNCAANRIVNNLVIIDEIFRGTNTIERIAAAKAVLSYFIENKIFIIISTHDLELATLLGDEYKVFSFEETAGDERLIFDYKIKEGLLRNENGIAVLKKLGYPQSIIDEASNVGRQLREHYDL